MRFINKQTQKGLFGLAKETMSTMFFNCIDGINKVQKEGWRSSFGARFDNIRRTGLPYHDLFKDDNNNGEDKVGN